MTWKYSNTKILRCIKSKDCLPNGDRGSQDQAAPSKEPVGFPFPSTNSHKFKRMFKTEERFKILLIAN